MQTDPPHSPAITNLDHRSTTQSSTIDLMNLLVKRIDGLTQALARPNALLAFTFCGALVGLLSSGVILIFRLLIDLAAASHFLQQVGRPDLRSAIQLAIGTLLLWALYKLLKTDSRQSGIAHVIQRLADPIARLPLVNMIGQFFGAALAIAAGFSVGREGPGVHLGAAAGSQLGIYLRLPNSSLRTLIGCGCAAAIAASFNTPLAAVIFTLEVLAIEYALSNLAPVIVASVTGTVLTRLIYGSHPAFAIPIIDINQLSELLYLVILGVFIGLLAALFIHLLEKISLGSQHAPSWQRFGCAGLAMALIGWWSPDSLGIGYSTIDAALAGQYLLAGLAALTLAKLVATAVCLGLGIPGGLIGPSMVIGAAGGGLVYALLVQGFGEAAVSNQALYVVVGMAAMMGATLQAPLTALVTLLEMGSSTNILLPGMIGIVTAGLVSRVGFKKESVFHQLLRIRGVRFEVTAMHKSLREVAVLSAVEQSFELQHQLIELDKVDRLMESTTRWILLHDGKRPVGALLHSDLVAQLENLEPENLPLAEPLRPPEQPLDQPQTINLMKLKASDELPLQWLTLSPIGSLATLDEANNLMIKEDTDGIYVQSDQAHGIDGIFGLLRSCDLERYYK